MKQAKVFLNNMFAGILTEDDIGYEFRYDPIYLESDKSEAVSLTLPLTDKPYRDKILFLGNCTLFMAYRKCRYAFKKFLDVLPCPKLYAYTGQ